jgi:multidrug efflux pump subunit AcrA (membrane-fusion protein)
MKRVLILPTVLAACLLAAALASCGKSGSASKNGGTAQAAETKPVHVTTATVIARQVPVFIQSSGTFVADETSNVAPLAAGRVAATPVNAGAFVNEGQVIAQLDQSDAKLRLDQALAAQAQAEAALRQSQSRIGLGQNSTFDANSVPEVLAALAAYQSAQSQAKLAAADEKRYANLVATGDVSRSNYEKQKTQAETAQAQADSARRQYEAAVNNARQNYQSVSGAEASLAGFRSQVAIARKALDDTIIRAPMSGYVSDRAVAVGEYVSTSSKIATIVRVNPIKLFLQISEAEAARLKVGMQATARVAAYGDRDFLGRVTVIRPAIDPTSRAMTVEVEFSNSDFTLKPGMFATARVLLPEGEQGLFVPISSVLTDATTSASQVFVIDSGKARAKVVRIGESENGLVRLLAGVTPGAVVASSGLKDLYDGVPVSN